MAYQIFNLDGMPEITRVSAVTREDYPEAANAAAAASGKKSAIKRRTKVPIMKKNEIPLEVIGS